MRISGTGRSKTSGPSRVRLSDTAAAPPQQDVEAGGQVPAAFEDCRGKGPLAGERGLGVGAFGDDPDVGQPALVGDGRDLVELNWVSHHELEDAVSVGLEASQHVRLVAPFERV